MSEQPSNPTPSEPSSQSPPTEELLPDQQRKPRLSLYLVGVLVLLGAGVYAGMSPRIAQRKAVEEESKQLSLRTFATVNPTPGKPPEQVTLSAELKPIIETPVYARASGYVRKWYVDLGAKVKEGELLAELETPEIDRELAEGRATLRQAEAALGLAESTAKRWEELAGTKSVSAQEVEEKRADAALKTAAMEAEKARVQRLEQLTSFSRITAPFDGTITSREVDVGQLVSAGSSHELFRLAKTNKLRAYIRVPQTQARGVRIGQCAEVVVPEILGETFIAKIIRTAGAMDTASRTLLTELEIDNEKGEILAGSYARVRLAQNQPDALLTLPANTLLFRAEGIQVGVVDAQNKVQMRTLKIGRDFGPNVEILGGVETGDRVVLNPPDSLASGTEVRLAAVEPVAASGEVKTAAR
ncbi:RND family efflux transporter MFP subunit [Roseimicrobium gellanilyticum]|uniref:RND family efflux transporter MFP subunit n=1 Tax=Roseimicrobium gellanilyticum TaxID=748857 RepID=A0A366HEF9_9BACT|nr:efflux RND transporter periplasmic adaptor subunit [Roseimicrobium gellanilyticum]RBP40440.1 RND family efflux transporter MFP subunit [Roseimicrobium gellanilyticum]